MSGKSINITLNRINKEFSNLQKSPIPNIIALPNPTNIFEWHFLIYGLQECPYEGGFYHGQLNLPPEYPMKPPSLEFITPNGRFKPNHKICISFTNYHNESWTIAWNIEKMLLATVSFMLSDENTTGAIFTSCGTKRQLARASIVFNMKNANFVKLFQPYFQKLGITPTLLEQSKQLQKEEELNSSKENFKKGLFFIVSLFIIMLIYFQLKISSTK